MQLRHSIPVREAVRQHPIEAADHFWQPKTQAAVTSTSAWKTRYFYQLAVILAIQLTLLSTVSHDVKHAPRVTIEFRSFRTRKAPHCV
jgi:hypothetical protein